MTPHGFSRALEATRIWQTAINPPNVFAREVKESAVNVADAKRQFSDLLGRVAYGRETIVIMRRGRPMAKLVPLQEGAEERNQLAQLEGWLAEDDPFFTIMDEIVSDRRRHHARVLDSGPVTKTPRQG